MYSVVQDTIKSKMQIQKEFASSSSFTVARSIWKTDGLVGFFRGCVPPLWGSMIYRGVMMSAYEFGYTWFLSNYDENSFFMRETAIGLRPFVPLSSIFAALTRGVIESMLYFF